MLGGLKSRKLKKTIIKIKIMLIITSSKVSKTKKLCQKQHKSKFQKYFKTYVNMPQIKKFRKQTIIRNKNIKYAIFGNFKNSN